MLVYVWVTGTRMCSWNRFENICQVMYFLMFYFLNQDNIKDFLEKKSDGRLLVQRTQKFIDALLAPVPLTYTPDRCVHFGDTVMLMCKGE